MIREFRPADTPVVAQLLTNEFPTEGRMLGMSPEMVFRVVKRVYRPDMRLLLGLLRLVGKPVYRFLIADDGGRAVGTTILSFPPKSVYISTVATDPSARRRGHARALLERSREIARRMGREYLVLDVLTDNTPARTLYEQRLGYVPLREVQYFVRDHPQEFGPEPSALPDGIRPFRPADEKALVALAAAETPPDVLKVLPRTTSGLKSNGFEERLFETTSAAWVVDRGAGPEAGVAVSRSPSMEAAHITAPIVAPGADPARVQAMVRLAGAWCGARGALRIAGSVPLASVRARAALEQEGFRPEISLWTLYRPTA
jgi:ribosomal protein S18 acetylase RimI-like enzyme